MKIYTGIGSRQTPPDIITLIHLISKKMNKLNFLNYADLRIAEVDGLYRIDEYDGAESVETPGSYEWQNANDFAF